MQEYITKRKTTMKKTNQSSDKATALRDRVRWFFGELIRFGGAVLLGQAPMAFGTYPIGLALLCASERHLPSILLGLIAAALWQLPHPLVYIAAFLSVTLIRLVLFPLLDSARRRETNGQGVEQEAPLPPRPQKRRAFLSNRRRLAAIVDSLGMIFNEDLRRRLLIGTVCAFLTALYRIIVGGFQYYDLFAACFTILLTPVAVAVLSPALKEGSVHPFLRHVSRAAILFSLIFAADGIAFLGIPVQIMLAFFFTLYACSSEHYALAVVASLLCGIAISPLYAPAYVLAALVFLLLIGFRRHGAGILFATIAMLSWTVYVGGASLLITHLPACLLAGSAMTVVLHDRLVRQAEREPDAQDEGETLRLRMEGDRHRDANDRFRGISEAFSSLSEVFYNLSDRFRRPGTLDLRRICDSSFDAFCADCPNKTVCWGLEYTATLGTVNELISALHTKGKVTRGQISEVLGQRCESIGAIVNRINDECARLTCEMLRNNRTEIFAMDYESAADIINDALEEDDGEYRFDREMEGRIAEYLSDAGVRMQGVTVYGDRRRRILIRGADLEASKVSPETLRADLGELCDREMAKPVFEVAGDVGTMVLQARPKISVIGAQNNVSADGGVSGDTVNLFSNKQDFFYALINDGMGAGREAALTSGLCSVFLEKMLRAGNRASTSLKMLNNMIRSRGGDSTCECSSTVDLVEVDLMRASANFLKSGAAPSFVIRGQAVHRLQAGTFPIGIIVNPDVQSSVFYLKEGDTIVMVSDGILQEDPEGEALSEYLSTVSELTPSEIVYHICLEAATREKHDDCSAIALRIQAAG